MCLAVLVKNRNVKKRWFKGYKLVEKRSDGYYTPFQHYKLEKHNEDTKEGGLIMNTIDFTGKTLPFYRTGFHIYKSFKAVKALPEMFERNYEKYYVVLEVRYTNVVATGIEGGCRVDVARTMDIVREVPPKREVKNYE